MVCSSLDSGAMLKWLLLGFALSEDETTRLNGEEVIDSCESNKKSGQDSLSEHKVYVQVLEGNLPEV